MTNHKKVRVSEAAAMLRVSAGTLRNWDKAGKLVAERSSGNQRYYPLSALKEFALDIEALGHVWAFSAIPPELPSDCYCERPDRFTSRVARMGAELQTGGRVSEQLASLLTLVAGEIGDNSFAHNVGSWPDVPGIFFRYDLDKRVIVIADRGRGVRATLKRVKPELADDLQALNVAFTEVISGRNPEKRGNGLKVVRRAVESNNIGLYFQSGIGSAYVSAKKPNVLSTEMADENIRGTYSVIKF